MLMTVLIETKHGKNTISVTPCFTIIQFKYLKKAYMQLFAHKTKSKILRLARAFINFTIELRFLFDQFKMVIQFF